MSPALDFGHFAQPGADEDLFGLIFAAIRKVRFYYKKTGDGCNSSLYDC